MRVAFGGHELVVGSFISPVVARHRPCLEITPMRRGVWCTIIMFDPDAVGGNKLHWLVANIRDREPGMTVLPYAPPNPPSGVHRYIIGVFEHNQPISPPRLSDRFITMPDLLRLLGDPAIVDAFFFLSGY